MAKKTPPPTFSVDDATASFASVQNVRLARAKAQLATLAHASAQVLLFEGGTEEEREGMARWWAMLEHCEQRLVPHAPPEPCCVCATCLQIALNIYSDVLVFDGRISNKEDEENPGPIRAFSMENARALKARLGDNTRSGRFRIVILQGFDSKRISAANALLKVLEEPSPTTRFVLLAAQREQLLPTLVSRSLVLTLPWPDTRHVPESLQAWEEALAAFVTHGRDWWSMTSGKGAVDAPTAFAVVLLCQKRLLPVLAQEEVQAPLSVCFARLSDAARFRLIQHLDAAEQALLAQVSPPRVLDALAVELYTLLQ